MPVPPPCTLRLCLFAPLRLTLPMRVLIIGSGYVGCRWAWNWCAGDMRVSGLRRKNSSRQLTTAGLKPLFATSPNHPSSQNFRANLIGRELRRLGGGSVKISPGLCRWDEALD